MPSNLLPSIKEKTSRDITHFDGHYSFVTSCTFCQLIQASSSTYHYLVINKNMNSLCVQQGKCFSTQDEWTWVSILPLDYDALEQFMLG
jgi:hypothetical protein